MTLFTQGDYPLNTTTEDIEFIFNLCKQTAYVTKNKDYDSKAKNTNISYSEENTQVNAYAMSHSQRSHSITILGGLSNATKLLAVALAEFKRTENLEQMVDACNWIGSTCLENQFHFIEDMIQEGIDELEYNLTSYLAKESKAFSVGLLLAVVAHELGHICLSHTLRDDVSNEISRNDERQADLFAQSVISDTPFAGYLILSSLFMEILFTWMGKNNDGPATTHPHSKERVYNTLNSHDEYLAELGITKDTIDRFLP